MHGGNQLVSLVLKDSSAAVISSSRACMNVSASCPIHCLALAILSVVSYQACSRLGIAHVLGIVHVAIAARYLAG
jgi:hypothetical protein